MEEREYKNRESTLERGKEITRMMVREHSRISAAWRATSVGQSRSEIPGKWTEGGLRHWESMGVNSGKYT